MKNPWIKLWRNTLSDEKLSFLIRRYGHECSTFWVALLTKCEDGVLLLDEDVFADLCFMEDKRYQEIRKVFIARGMVAQDDDGRLVVVNWDEYQTGESTDRVRRFRDRQRQPVQSPAGPPAAPDVTISNAYETVCNGSETEMERSDIEGEGEEEGEVDIYAESREISAGSSDSPPKAKAPQSSPPIPDHFELANAWYRRFAHARGVLLGPSEKDRLRARDLLACIDGNLPVALKAIDWYFEHWRRYWFAVSKPTRAGPDSHKKPDFSFPTFCANFAVIAGDAVSGSTSPSGQAGEAAWMTKLREAGFADPQEQTG